MKTAIIALNSKYIHSALAPWYLMKNCTSECGEVKVLEFSINEMPDSVLTRIYEEKCDVAAFSCYIWNIEYVLKTAHNLKKILPGIRIILGGPEVSFDTYEIMKQNSFIDYIISGEAEMVFGELLRSLVGKFTKPDGIEGLTYRAGEQIVCSDRYAKVEDLNNIRSPYSKEMLHSAGNKIVYYESSRGCPFNCSYCLSSTFKGVRYFSMDRVREDLQAFLKAEIKMVKFVDRTFNCNPERAKEIFSFVIDNAGLTRFHFEAAADLFDEEMLAILSRAPKGLIQFEIGIQTTNNDALKAVNRKTELNKVFSNIKKLRDLGNIHIHLDLIAGLPYEGYESFKRSFNEVYGIDPQQLQVGFLKLLKGSLIRNEAAEHGYRFRDYPPYEVLGNKYLGFDELVKLKNIEDMVDRFFNSGRFKSSIKYLADGFFASPFDFYEKLSMYFKKAGYFDRSLSSRDLYTIILKLIESIGLGIDLTVINEFLKFDFLISNNTNNLPAGLKRNLAASFKEKCFDFLKDEENIRKYIPHFSGESPKHIYNKVHFEVFLFDVTKDDYNTIHPEKRTVVLFDYTNSNEVTGHFSSMKVPIA